MVYEEDIGIKGTLADVVREIVDTSIELNNLRTNPQFIGRKYSLSDEEYESQLKLRLKNSYECLELYVALVAP